MKNVRAQLSIYLCLFLAGSLYGQQSSPTRQPSAEPATSVAAAATAAAQPAVPRLIKFNGVLRDLSGKPIAGPVDVIFSLYSDEAGGAALWFETQTVQADGHGNYTVLLGAMSPTGVPMELFTSGEAHWLGVQVLNLPEQSRVLLVSVPYAMKAGDAETLGGKPASAYLLSSQADAHAAATAAALSGMITSGATKTTTSSESPVSNTFTQNYIPVFSDNLGTTTNSIMFQSGTKIGINTNAPAFNLDVNGNAFAIGPKAAAPGTGGTMRFRDDTGTVRWLFGIPGSAGSQDFQMYNYTNGRAPIFIQNGAASYSLYMHGNGNVGILTNNPTFPLDVNGNILGVGTKTASAGKGGMVQFRDDTGAARWAVGLANTSGATSFRIGDIANSHDVATIEAGAPANSVYVKSTGNVGIGTINPVSKLDVAGSVRITGNGNALVFPDGSVMTSAGAGTNGGTITAVNAGAGLVGGGTSGSVTLYLDTTMVPTFATSSNIFTGDITANSFTGAVTGTTGTFTANSGGQVLGATQTGSGPAMQAVTTSATSGAAAVLGNASSATGNTVGVWGRNSSPSGIAIRGDNNSATGTALGVYGSSTGTSGVGVQGDATAVTGNTTGVLGSNASTAGIGVQGAASATTGNTIGVRGLNLSATGIGVSGESSDATGTTVGVQGIVNSSSGTAALFQNNGGGDILLGKQGSTTVFHVDAAGNVTAGGTVTANLFTSSTGLTATTVSATTGTFTANTGGPVLGANQSGSGPGFQAVTTAGSSGAVAVLGNASSTSGNTVGVWGTNSSTSGIALRGDSSATTGSAFGVYGSTASTAGIGVEGNATATTGTTSGVVGASASTAGIGVHGDATATTGSTTGVLGSSASTAGIGVQGETTTTTGNTIGVRGVNLSATGTGVSGEASSSTGATVGVHGYSNSASGTAGLFENVNGGNILIGKQGVSQVFLVDASGNVTANSFSSLTNTGTISAGTADFSGVNGTEIASITQGGTGAGLYATSTSTSGGATAVVASATGTSGSTNGVWATNASAGGVAVRADATSTTGANVGVYGTSASTSGTAVRGSATATSGTTVGVYGTNASSSGTAVEGDATSTTGSTVALYGSNVSTGGIAVKGSSTATSGTTVGVYGTNASASGIGVRGDNSATSGTALGVYGTTASSAGIAVEGYATNSSASTTGVGVKGISDSTGGTGVYGYASASGASTTGIGVQGSSQSSGGIGVKGTVSGASATAGAFDNSGGGDILLGTASGVHKFRVDGSGVVYGSNFLTSGADFAESVDVAGSSDDYEPGDVMAVDPQGRRRLVLATGTYSTGVAGIFSTKPGMLATPHLMDDPRLAKEIPLAVVGIVPCKVSAENGAIRPGDLLVTSSIPGHAMKGTDRGRMLGAIVGKALQSLDSGTGVIEVLVTLQ